MPHEEKHQVSVIMNNGCNIGCKYCYAQEEHKHPYKAIDLEFAKKGVEDFLSLGNKEIRFFGLGEPTLELGLINEVINHAQGIVGDSLVTEIQTNGVMSAQKAAWLGRTINNIWISWDGPPEFHDQFRTTKKGEATSHYVENSCKAMLDSKHQGMAKGFIGARATITPHSVSRQREIIDYLISYGINIIYADPIFNKIGDSRSRTSIAGVDAAQYCDLYIDAYRYAKRKGIFYGSLFIINFDKQCKFHCRSCLPTPHLTFDGYVSACDMALSINCPEHMKCLLYGKWNTENKIIKYDCDKILKITTRNVENIKECRNCEIKNFCGGGCLGEALNETGDFYGIIKGSCECTKIIAQHIPPGNVYIPALHP